MIATHRLALAGLLAVVALASAGKAEAPSTMTFLVTSSGPGKGADLGGLAGADAHCQALAQAAGAGNRTWRIYLSLTGASPSNARDRIGRGPWQNAKGEVIANDVEDLHSANNKLTKLTALSEKGEVINGRGDTPNRHDIWTGSQPDGRAFPRGREGIRPVAIGRRVARAPRSSDITTAWGLNDSAEAKSWNSSHGSRACDQASLRATGGMASSTALLPTNRPASLAESVSRGPAAILAARRP